MAIREIGAWNVRDHILDLIEDTDSGVKALKIPMVAHPDPEAFFICDCEAAELGLGIAKLGLTPASVNPMEAEDQFGNTHHMSVFILRDLMDTNMLVNLAVVGSDAVKNILLHLNDDESGELFNQHNGVFTTGLLPRLQQGIDGEILTQLALATGKNPMELLNLEAFENVVTVSSYPVVCFNDQVMAEVSNVVWNFLEMSGNHKPTEKAFARPFNNKEAFETAFGTDLDSIDFSGLD